MRPRARLGVAALILTALTSVGVSNANADTPPGNAVFRTAGAPVYPPVLAPAGCRGFGVCGGFTADQGGRAVPMLLSQRPGQPLQVVCRVDRAYRVTTGAVTGWADVGDVALTAPVAPSARC